MEVCYFSRANENSEATAALFAVAVKWKDIVDLSRKRRRFLTIYNQPGGADNDELLDEVYEIDSKISYHAAMTFRCIAHLERAHE